MTVTTLMSGGEYDERVREVFGSSLLYYARASDTDTTIRDSGPSHFDVASGWSATVDLADASIPVGGRVPRLNGTAYGNVNSAGLRSAINTQTGTVGMVVRSHIWEDDTAGFFLYIRNAAATEQIYLRKSWTNFLQCAHVGNGVTRQYDGAITQADTSNWVHLALTWDATSVKVYVNGTLVSTMGAASVWISAVSLVMIGAQNTTPGSPHAGWIGHVAIGNTALGQAAITRLASGVRSGGVSVPTNLLSLADTAIEAFETIGDWTAVYGSVSDDTTYVRAGSHALRVTSMVGDEGLATKNVSLDLSGPGTLRLWVYIHNVSDLAFLRLRCYTGSDYFQRAWSFANKQLVTGWNYLMFVKTDFVQSGTPDWANITQIGMQIRGNAGVTAVVTFDDLRLTKGVPALALVFDDGRDDVYNDAWPILHQAGMRCTANIVTNLIGTGGFMTVAQLNELYNDGWTIGNHTANHPNDLTVLSQAAQEAEISEAIADLNALGFNLHSLYFSYPGSAWNADTITSLTNQGIRFAIGNMDAHPYNALPMTSIYLIDTVWLDITPLATAIGFLDYAYANGILCVMNIDGLNGASQWTSAELQTFIDHFKGLSGMRCLTMHDLYKLRTADHWVPA